MLVTQVDPEFSEEARKAKVAGIVVVNPDRRPEWIA